MWQNILIFGLTIVSSNAYANAIYIGPLVVGSRESDDYIFDFYKTEWQLLVTWNTGSSIDKVKIRVLMPDTILIEYPWERETMLFRPPLNYAVKW